MADNTDNFFSKYKILKQVSQKNPQIINCSAYHLIVLFKNNVQIMVYAEFYHGLWFMPGRQSLRGGVNLYSVSYATMTNHLTRLITAKFTVTLCCFTYYSFQSVIVRTAKYLSDSKISYNSEILT